jgi:Putative amidoligase enzyme
MPTRTLDVRYTRNVHDITMSNLPTRYYAPTVLHGDTVPAGVWTDHGSRDVQDIVYRLRNLQGDDRLTHEEITAVLGLRHWRDSYNAARNVGRRRDGDSGRNTAGELTWRRWNRQRNMRHTPAAPARPGARADGSLVSRRFGIEIEFNRGTGDYDQRQNILRDCTTAGIRCQEENYNHHTRPHWKMTTDATVTGGEFVSPIMAGDTASLDEVRDVIRIIRSNGGESTQTVGMHVHHDVTDFTTPAMRVALIDALEGAEHALAQFVLPARADGLTSCGSGRYRTGEWTAMRARVGTITPGSEAHLSNHEYTAVDRYRFFNIGTPMRKYGTVEFRGLGATLHAGKVRVWVRMGQAVIEAARQGYSIPVGCTPRELADRLISFGLLGRQTADKFVSECARRHPV